MARKADSLIFSNFNRRSLIDMSLKINGYSRSKGKKEKRDMNLKYLFYTRGKENTREYGNIIEPLIVSIVITILGIIALPNLLSQVGKAREIDARNVIKTISLCF